eukprot:8939356-Alexandrium_andersonii.AAC.1
MRRREGPGSRPGLSVPAATSSRPHPRLRLPAEEAVRGDREEPLRLRLPRDIPPPRARAGL